MATRSSLRFLSFNMHGYNLSHLCQNFDILFLQEHWLLPSELSLFTACAPNFVVFGSSALQSSVSRDILRGRPYGGVTILVRSELASHC